MSILGEWVKINKFILIGIIRLMSCFAIVRWRGENVATSEVEAVISNVIDLKNTIVYGVQVNKPIIQSVIKWSFESVERKEKSICVSR